MYCFRTGEGTNRGEYLMRYRFGITGLLIGGMLVMSALFAPASSAAGGCSDPMMNWQLHQKIRSGHYVIRNYYSTSHHSSCLIVRRGDGKRVNVQLLIERDYVHKGKQTTHSTRTYRDVKKVARTFGTDNVRITVQVFASRATRNTLPYRGTTTLLRS
jgi:hypothetical protein